MIRKILVTGSSGTIGTRLCETLLSKGFDVVGADWKPNRWNEAVQKVTVNVDLRDRAASLECLPKDADLAIHLAAEPRVYKSVVDPMLARDNSEMTFNVLEHARLSGIRRFMFASSREVYGNSEKTLHAEDDMRVPNCESPYTASKIGGEAMTWAYGRCYGIDVVIFRFSNVYGMYDASDRLIPLYIKRAAAGEDLVVFGREKMLDFTYIDDTVAGVMAGIERFEAAKNEVFNVAASRGVPFVDLAERVKAILGSPSKIVVKENRTGEVLKYVADISKARALLGFEPRTPIEEGLVKTVAWYKDFWKL